MIRLTSEERAFHEEEMIEEIQTHDQHSMFWQLLVILWGCDIKYKGKGGCRERDKRGPCYKGPCIPCYRAQILLFPGEPLKNF